MSDKEYLPELQIGQTYDIGPYGEITEITPFSNAKGITAYVDQDFKQLYEGIARRTGLNFKEIMKEQMKLFSIISRSEYETMTRNHDLEETAKLISEGILKMRG